MGNVIIAWPWSEIKVRVFACNQCVLWCNQYLVVCWRCRSRQVWQASHFSAQKWIRVFRHSARLTWPLWPP